MRIAVMGAGGVGGYFGARLAQAGNEVAFIARGAHLAAMRERGLRVRSPNGEVHLPRPTVTDDPGALAPADIVVFAVARDTESAAAAVRPLGCGGRRIVPFQAASVASSALVRSSVPRRVMGGVAQIAATIAEPGVIAHTGTMARLRFGGVLAAHRPAAEALLAACKGAGIDAELVADIRRALWEKFVFLAAFSGLTSVARQSIGLLRRTPKFALRWSRRCARRGRWVARGVWRSPTISSRSR
jgi:2-dehydropantoate 2-reductase